MNIALHDSEGMKFPNLALMKISAWHKANGDRVEWFNALMSDEYDKVYSAKVFTFTPVDPYLPDMAVRGGTGYGLKAELPAGIEHIRPDYDLYPQADFALGFLTRGCIRQCPWCIVPKKEGTIREHAFFEEFARHDTRNIVFMDNNVLAHEHGIREIERLAGSGYKVDFNQGLDARIIGANPDIAKRLAALKWYKPLRLACDKSSQMPHVEKAAGLLRSFGCKPSIFSCYVLVTDIEDAYRRVEFLRRLNIDPFAQPYRDFEKNLPPSSEQRRFARWVNHKAIFKTVAWKDYLYGKAI